MPELPEVEVVCRQLQKEIAKCDQIKKVQFLSPKLRTDLKLPKNLEFPLKTVHLQRRSKYILFCFDKGFFVTHLGMTGQWRILRNNLNLDSSLKKHDHVLIFWKDGDVWVYNDTRRFGVFEFCKDLDSSKWLKNLGPEPLTDDFDEAQVIGKIQSSERVIKDTIMDAKVIVGVGNIYACEALFLSHINPFRKASKIKKEQLSDLLKGIQKILKTAIKNGGSTIQNYTQTNGESGKFQNRHKVYGREGLACKVCSEIIQRKMFHGRSTFWCPHCQK